MSQDLKSQKLKSYSTEQYRISSQGLQHLLRENIYPNDITRNVNWTDDYRVQLPIKVGSQGIAALPPRTIIQAFQKSVEMYGSLPALSKKINGKWVTLTYNEYYNQSLNFAKGLIALRTAQFTGVNIIGFNAPEWNIAFIGSIFARCIPVGIYSTNSQQICQYIFTHSRSKIVVAENFQYAKKYLNLLKSKELQYIIIYNDQNCQIPKQFEERIKHWREVIEQGKRVQPHYVRKRMDKVKPGNCASIVYTSGTTGMPKGVLISHDNYTWTFESMQKRRIYVKNQQQRLVSYLPLSHVAGQFADIIASIIDGVHIYFADPSALQGTLIQTLIQVKPSLFFSVPRVWQKIYERMQLIAKQNGWLKTKFATWAKEQGLAEAINKAIGQRVSWSFWIADKIIFTQIKKRLGLDQCKYFMYGAAPLNPEIRKYFLSLGIPLVNTYGMSQSTGPNNLTEPSIIQNIFNKGMDPNNVSQFREVGINLPGTEIKIVRQNQKDQDGQICYRGRNIFMGYYRNPQQTAKTIDSQGFLHSGDNGILRPNGQLFITGRVKELIITAGGQNIPPILIENELFKQMPFLSNAMVVGDNQKYLTCLIALKQDPPGSGKIQKLSLQYLKSKNCEVQTVQQAKKSQKFQQIVMQGLKKANQRAISRAQYVQAFFMMPEEFSVQNGLLTPTLKIKRKEVVKKYANQIKAMYMQPKL